MAVLTDTIRRFTAIGGDSLWVAAAASQPFVAVDPQQLRIEVAAGASAQLVVVYEKG